MTLALTQGEPAGIGLDLIVKILHSHTVSDLDICYIGDVDALRSRAELLGLTSKQARQLVASLPCEHLPLTKPCTPGEVSDTSAPQVLECLKRAHRGCLTGTYSGMVTNPVHKHILARVEPSFVGQTDYLAALSNNKHGVSMLIGDSTINTVIATRHMPLAEVSARITNEALILAIDHAVQFNREYLNKKHICLTVLGLNPHAGEGGLLGREDLDIITPAILQWQANQTASDVEIQGPVPADTAFLPDMLQSTDTYISMYHDQALPVVKSIVFQSAVNTTLGLPYVRTSPDHGTALNLVGTNSADSSSLYAALVNGNSWGNTRSNTRSGNSTGKNLANQAAT